MNTTSVNYVAFVLIMFWVGQCHQQHQPKDSRIKTIWHLILDLRNGTSNEDIFRNYIMSQGQFSNDTIKRVANGATNALRTALENANPKDVRVYRYLNHRDRSLEFTLDVSETETLPVNCNDLYVLKIDDVKHFFLFNETRIVTYFGILSRNKVSLVTF